ncbi:unnamed protein product [Diamesa serratosioi]
MKLVILVVAVLSVVLASPIPQNEVQIVRYVYDHRGLDGYSFLYDLTDNQYRSEEGNLVQVGDKQVLRVTGSYFFVGTDGKNYNVIYTADENGYHPIIKEVEEPQVAYISPTVLKSLIG